MRKRKSFVVWVVAFLRPKSKFLLSYLSSFRNYGDFKEFNVIRALTVKSDVWTNFVQTSDFTVKALMISNSLYDCNFQTKTDTKVKICFCAQLCTQNKILASKMRNFKRRKTSVFAPLILKRWICVGSMTKKLDGKLDLSFSLMIITNKNLFQTSG